MEAQTPPFLKELRRANRPPFLPGDARQLEEHYSEGVLKPLQEQMSCLLDPDPGTRCLPGKLFALVPPVAA